MPRFGAMQGILRRSGGELVKVAARLGFDGVELIVSGSDLNHPYFTEAGQQVVRDACATYGIEVPSLCLGGFNGAELALKNPQNHARAIAFLRRAIAAARTLGAPVLLIPFFGDGELFTRAEQLTAADALRELLAEAEAAGVTLALENTLRAADNIMVLERLGSSAARIYFDVSNAMWWGMNAPDEIRAYGQAGVLSQVHFKDGKGDHSNAMLGEGHVDFPACVAALREVGYDGWIVLESAAPHDPDADASANLAFARGLFAT
ncbi:MAG: TIM barrel protein [Armatimonadetes bacterium]|nr:TIM barrel protein [Armatimonadota bacterium]